MAAKAVPSSSLMVTATTPTDGEVDVIRRVAPIGVDARHLDVHDDDVGSASSARWCSRLRLVALVVVQLRPRATGTGRLARGFLHAEHVMPGLAIVSSLQWLLGPDLSESAFFLALDLFWPLSMLGMAALGIRIEVAGHWRGAARIWPTIAETWALVLFPAMALVSEEATTVISAGHLFAGSTMLGVIPAVRPT